MVTCGDSIRPNSISIFDAIRELHQCIKAAASESDPAPWCDVPPTQIEMFSKGDEAAYVRGIKIQERSKLVMQRALLSGDLRGYFDYGSSSYDVPGWAWENAARAGHAWNEGRLPLGVLLPDEWQRWSCHTVYLDRNAFTEWLGSSAPHDLADLPDMPAPYDVASKPAPVKRPPPDAPFVTLSEALTWIAFGYALDSDGLRHALSCHAISAPDPEAALADAVAKFTAKASGGTIAMLGKLIENSSADEDRALTARIDPVLFHDFAQFDIIHDGLRCGTGLTLTNKRNGHLDRARQRRRDALFSVKVNRADLLREFRGSYSIERGAGEIEGNPKAARRRPGPAPDSDWPIAITKVTNDCLANGYMRPLKRGEKAAIQTMLLSFMAEKDKHFSEDIAAKHAETVIAALPDRSLTDN